MNTFKSVTVSRNWCSGICSCRQLVCVGAGGQHIFITVFAIYLILLGWKSKYYYETDELPNPRLNPTQEKWHLGNFFPQQIIFRGLGLVLFRKQTKRNPTQPNSPETPYELLTVVSLCARVEGSKKFIGM